jgi:hypothetical protein
VLDPFGSTHFSHNIIAVFTTTIRAYPLHRLTQLCLAELGDPDELGSGLVLVPEQAHMTVLGVVVSDGGNVFTATSSWNRNGATHV